MFWIKSVINNSTMNVCDFGWHKPAYFLQNHYIIYMIYMNYFVKNSLIEILITL